MYNVKMNKIEALAQEYNLSNTQVEILKFYTNPDNKYVHVYTALDRLGIKKTIQEEIDIDWLFIWKFLRQADDGYPVPIYLGI